MSMHHSPGVFALLLTSLVAGSANAQTAEDPGLTLERAIRSRLFFVAPGGDGLYAILGPATPDLVEGRLRTQPRPADSEVLLRSAPIARAHRAAFAYVENSPVRLAAQSGTCDASLRAPVIVNILDLTTLGENVPRSPGAADRAIARVERDPDLYESVDPSLWVAAPIDGGCPAVIGTFAVSGTPQVYAPEDLDGEALAQAVFAYRSTPLHREIEEAQLADPAATTIETRAERFSPPSSTAIVFVSHVFQNTGCGDPVESLAVFSHQSGVLRPISFDPQISAPPIFVGDVDGDGIVEIVLWREFQDDVLYLLAPGARTAAASASFGVMPLNMGC
jgi:hypothetical protein